MKCPICGSKSFKIVKSKKRSTKSELIENLILKCCDCQTTFREELRSKKAVKKRIIISEYEKSFKDMVDVYPDEELKVGSLMQVGEIMVEISSLETKNGSRVQKSRASDLETIWGSSLNNFSRVGISVDFNGKIYSKKVEIERDFIFTIGDIIKIENITFKIKSFKTIERKMRRGSALAGVIKRIYGRPVESNRFNYDLSKKIIKI